MLMNRIFRVSVLLMVVLSVLGINPHTAQATMYSQPEVNINGGGGLLTNGTDGLLLRLNLGSGHGGEKLCWRNENYHDDPSTDCPTGTAGALVIIMVVVDTTTPADTAR